MMASTLGLYFSHALTGFGRTSLMTWSVLYVCVLRASRSAEMSLESWPTFKCAFLSFLWLSCENVLHLLGSRFQLNDLQTSSPMLCSVCTFLMVSLEAQKFNFDEVQFISFFLLSHVSLVSHLRNYCLTQSHEDSLLCFS